MKTMQPDPERRYQSAAGLAADLMAFRAGGPVSAEAEAEDEQDADATRRTHRSAAEPDEATRRTAKGLSPPPARQASGAAASGGSFRSRAQRVLIPLAGIAIAYIAYAMISAVVLWRRGQQLDRDIHAEAVTDPDEIWNRWAAISKSNAQALALFGPRHSVRKREIAAADRIIERYRHGESQPVHENDWRRARAYLAHALELDPGDESVRGKLRLCEGHIDRINGGAHHNAAMLNEAVEKFEEAEPLLPGSPDPELGLANVYVYGLKEIDKAYAALQEAERHGYKLGQREKAQLADGYRDRGDRLYWDSRKIRGLPQERDQIQKAADDYGRALELYQSIAPYGNSSANIARVESSLETVKYRLEELASGSP
jgi:tetratricopeptide (TPR) repeat protein